MQSLASLGHTNCFVADYVGALSQAFENASLFFMQFCRNHNRDRPADSFLGAPSEQSLSTPIPAHYDSVEIFGEDGIVRSLDDRSKLKPRSLCAEMPFTESNNAAGEGQESEHSENL